jgi:hypothetical protein
MSEIITFEPTAEIKQMVIEQEIRIWNNTLYQAQVRHRVQKLIGAEEPVLKGFEADMERAMKVIDAYMVELAEVKKEGKREQPTADHP